MPSTRPTAGDAGNSAPLAALLSSILPGWGQVYTGRTRAAYRFFAFDLLLAAALLVVAARFRLEAVKAWVSLDALILLMVFNVALLVYRILAVGGAYRAASVSVPQVYVEAGWWRWPDSFSWGPTW